MSESSDEAEQTPIERIQTALLEFVNCIGGSLEDICSYSLTIGEAYVPFDPDPDNEDCGEGEAMCSQAWVRVMGIQPSPGTQQGWDGGDCSIVMEMTLEVGVLRCIELPDGGEAPTESNVMVAALQALEDMNAIHCAAMNCEVWDSIMTGTWAPNGPLGGQYGGVWDFTVTL